LQQRRIQSVAQIDQDSALPKPEQRHLRQKGCKRPEASTLADDKQSGRRFMERSSDNGSQQFDASSDASSRGESSAYYSDGKSSPARYQQWLQRTIETEVIPRLMLAHRLMAIGPGGSSSELGSVPDLADIETFTSLLLQDDEAACDDYIAALRNRPVALESIFLDLFTGSARRLGEFWTDDLCDFTQVTLGLWRIQKMVYELSSAEPAHLLESTRTSPLRALLVAAPGSQHTLGLTMVCEFFRRAGWDVYSEPCANAHELTELARHGWFDVIGLSASVDDQLESLESFIAELRSASRNPSVGVMVGGPVFLNNASLVGVVGADFTACDARQAVELAESFAFASQQK
jgi:methanogenic corrinoid protein MtbC1